MTSFERIQIRPGSVEDRMAPGVIKISENMVQISVWKQGATGCDVWIYENRKKYCYSMFSSEEWGMEDFFTICLAGEKIADKLQGLAYDFEAGGEHFVDPYAREIDGRNQFGRTSGKIRARFDFSDFDWSDENRRRLSADEMILYQCHVRGYTRHRSSGVMHPGTFSGLQEKISYLKELGINTLLLLPIYDFNERMDDKEDNEQKKTNYWGYTGDAFYFSLKASYGSGVERVSVEFRKLVKELHQNGMNLMMDMYFVNKTPEFVLSCLRYYALRFHVDGFRVNQEYIAADWIKQDPVLRHVKMLGYHWEEQEKLSGQEQLLEMNDSFLIDARRFLKSDERQVERFYRRFWEQKKGVGMIHCITWHNGFTLRDLVSYDRRHNEDNGEKNQDGMECNYSWNCGAEGASRRKEVNRRRACQQRNAFAMMILGMASPMILAGDEFGNTQKGNNNAYCQDNAVTWLDWNLLEKNRELFQYVKQLIAFRCEHPLYHSRSYLTGMDTKGIGAPDVSCHGEEPWNPKFLYDSREMAVLYCGEYYGGKSLYMAFNFHWESHDFYLPNEKGCDGWKLLLDTSGTKEDETVNDRYTMLPRSIAVLESIPDTVHSLSKKKEHRELK